MYPIQALSAGASGLSPSQAAPVSLIYVVAAAAGSHRSLMLRRGSIPEGAVFIVGQPCLAICATVTN